MGLHSTLFGPVKYAYLPQHLDEAELTGGNGMVEMGTFVAILLGTIAGGVLVGIPGAGPHWVAGVSIALAVIGRVAAGFVPVSPAADPRLAINWNPFSETWKNLGHARTNRAVFLSLLGISWLWFFGSIFLTSFTGFARETLGGDQNVVTLLLGIFSVGIGVGSLLCEKLSGHKVEIGLVPFGSIGMTLFAVDLWHASSGMVPAGMMGLGAFLADHAHWRIMADLFLLAMFGGFYSVPLYALIQSRCEPSHRARIIAANNILNALFMVVASIMAASLLHAGLTLPQLYLVTGLLNAAVAVYIYTLVPEFLMRFIVWMLIPYRVPAREIGHRAHSGQWPGTDRVQPCELRRRARHFRGLPAADPLRHGPSHLRAAGDFVRVSHHPCDPDRAGEGRPGHDGAGIRGSRQGAARGRSRVHLSGGAHYGHGRDVPVPARHQADPRCESRAGRSGGAEGALGLVLLAQGRSGDEQAIALRAFQEDRARGWRKCGRRCCDA